MVVLNVVAVVAALIILVDQLCRPRLAFSAVRERWRAYLAGEALPKRGYALSDLHLMSTCSRPARITHAYM